MNLPDDCKLTYYFQQEQHYYEAIRRFGEDLPTLSIVASSNGGGCAWEFSIEVADLGHRPNTRIRMFDDSYTAFKQIPEFFAAMAERQPTDLPAVAAILAGLGGEDVTERLAPESERRSEVARLREQANRIEATYSPVDA